MDDLPKRRSPRLKDYDYSSNGAYFLTLCTDKRRNLLSDITVGAIHESPEIKLSKYGEIVDEIIKILPDRFCIDVEKYVIMPNHIHMLVIIKNNVFLRSIHESTLQKRSTVSKLIGYLKMNSSREIHKIDPYEIVWQRSYHDHIIRDEKDHLKIWDYINSNPQNWFKDCFYIE